MIDWPELSRIIAAFISGVVLTFIGHLFALKREREKSRKEVIVFCDYSVSSPQWWISNGSEYRYDFVVIAAVNNGQRPITISDAGLMMNTGRYFRKYESKAGKWRLPVKINDGDITQFRMDFDTVVSVLKENNAALKDAWVQDATGRLYRGQISGGLREKLTEHLA